jgi:hypothetical protein
MPRDHIGFFGLNQQKEIGCSTGQINILYTGT